MDNYFKPIGTTKGSEPDAGGGAVRSEPVFAVVKNNIDPTRAGRLQVYIADFNYSVVKRGGSNHDLWNISVTLEEV